MVRYEFSKDFKEWTSTINGEDIHKRIEDGSYCVRTGYSLGETVLTDTLTFDIASDYETRLAFVGDDPYLYCRAYKDEILTFVGMLSEDFQSKIETAETVSYTLKYKHLHELFEDVEFGGEEDTIYQQEDGIKVLDSSDQSHSLVHILVNKLFAANPDFPFTFQSDIELPYEMLYYKASPSDKVIDLLMTILTENGLTYMLNLFDFHIIDVIPTITEGKEIYDIEADAQIQHKAWIDRDVPAAKIFYYETVEDQVVYDDVKGGFFGGLSYWFWGFNFSQTYKLTFPSETENVEVYDVKITSVYCDAISYNLNYVYNRSDRTVTVTGNTNLLGTSYRGTRIKATVTYRVAKTIVVGKENDLEPVDAISIFSEEQAERYIKAMEVQKAQEAEEWTFYSKEKLELGEVVQIYGIPSSILRIREIEDTDDIFGGYTYSAYPYTEPVNEWTQVGFPEPTLESTVEYYPVEIEANEQLIIQSGTFVHNPIRFYIISDNPSGKPTVYHNGATLEVKRDVPESPTQPSDYNGYTGNWCFDFTFTDITIESYTFNVQWDDAETVKTYVPLVLSDAKVLMLTSDITMFSLKSDGTPYPNQTATVKVRKEGITDPTKWTVPNKTIADNTESIEVTAEDLIDGILAISVSAGEYSDSLTLNSVKDGQQGYDPVLVTMDVTSYIFPATSSGIVTSSEYAKFLSTATVSQLNDKFTAVESGQLTADGQFYLSAVGDGITNLAVSGASVLGTESSIMANDTASITVTAYYRNMQGVEGSVSYRISLAKAKEGQMGATLQVLYQFQYGVSDTEPPLLPELWFWQDGFIVSYGSDIPTDPVNEGWVSVNPDKIEGKPFLWQRISKDNGETWVYTMITGEAAKFLKLYASNDSFYVDSDGNMVGVESITVTCEKQNISDPIVWNIPYLEIAEDSSTAEIPASIFTEHTDLGYITVSVTAGSYSDKLTISKTIEVSKIIDEFSGLESSITQTASMIALKVTSDGKVQTSAGIEVGVLDGNGYILLDAENVIATGTITGDKIKANTISGNNIQSNSITGDKIDADTLTTKNLEVSGNDFSTVIKETDSDGTSNPVFEVKYGGKTIFKIIPNSGNIFFGEPNSTLDSPISGFMYNASSGEIVTIDRNIVIDSDGKITANNGSFSGEVTAQSGYFGGSIDCPSFSSLPPSTGTTLTIEVPSGTPRNQFETITDEISKDVLYRCTNSILSSAAYIKCFGDWTKAGDHLYYYDSSMNIVGRYWTEVNWGTPSMSSSLGSLSYTLTIQNIDSVDVFKFKDLPTDPTLLEEGQAYRDSNGFVKVKI